jgi:hypothetical protein
VSCMSWVASVVWSRASLCKQTPESSPNRLPSRIVIDHGKWSRLDKQFRRDRARSEELMRRFWGPKTELYAHLEGQIQLKRLQQNGFSWSDQVRLHTRCRRSAARHWTRLPPRSRCRGVGRRIHSRTSRARPCLRLHQSATTRRDRSLPWLDGPRAPAAPCRTPAPRSRPLPGRADYGGGRMNQGGMKSRAGAGVAVRLPCPYRVSRSPGRVHLRVPTQGGSLLLRPRQSLEMCRW